MAPNVTLHFFAANDINGDVLHEITDEDTFFRELVLKPERDGLGSADLLLSRTINFAGFASGTFQPEVFVRFLVHAYSDTLYYPWGLSLSKRQQVVVARNEKGEEVFRFGGPGPKSLLQRHALGINDNLGTGEWNIDLDNGVWRWTSNASVGQILNRVLNEDQARPDPSLPFMDTTFNASHDSNGVAWADLDVAADGLFTIPIGNDYLTILHDMGDILDLSSWIDMGEVGEPAYVLNVIQGPREDRTGSAFGAGVCLLKEGENIANDSLTVEGQNLRKASHVIVEGADGEWVVAERPSFSPGDYVKYAKIEYTRSNSDYWLEKAGIRWLTRQDLGEREITVEIVPGADDAAGAYFPAPDRVLWLDNLVSVDTSADGSSHSQLDIDPADDQLVTAFELALGPAGDTANATAKARSWDVKAILNRERPGVQAKSPSQASATSGDSCKCTGVRLCPVHVPGTSPSEVVTPLYNWNANGDGGDSLDWTGLLANQTGGAEGSTHNYFKSSAPDQYATVLAVSPGVVLRISGYVGLSGSDVLKVGFFTVGVGSPGDPLTLVESPTVLKAAPAPAWTFFTHDITVPATTVGFALGRTSGPNFDQIEVSSVAFDPGTGGQEGTIPEDVGEQGDEATGTDACAARGDHVHAHGLLSEDEAHYHDADQVEGGATGADLEALEDAVEALEAEVASLGGGVGAILISDTHSTPLVFADMLQNDDGTGFLYGDV